MKRRIALAMVLGSLLAMRSSAGADELAANAEKAWAVAWSRFFQKDVEIFADYLSSYDPGRELLHLPTAEEVRRQYPNPCGYSTGMEDGMILGGAMLSIIADRYAATGDETLRAKMEAVFRGMRLSATVHGVSGFVARNVCPEDQKSVYINSSRDQYTHYVHGLWKYYHSPLADEPAKKEIRLLLAAIADRMIEFVTPANDYDFCRADGKRCPLGICRMWNVQAHEAARLPMIYAAAWDTTREERYRQEWRKYAADAVGQSANPDPNKPAYALLQMQCSLEVLGQLEPDDALRAKIQSVMQHVAGLAALRSAKVWSQISKKETRELQMLGPDWRHVAVWKDQKGYPNPQWGPYREIWHLTREVGESAMVPLMVDSPELSAEQTQLLRDVIASFDYEHNSSCGVIYHIGAYWKARRCRAL